MDATDMNGRAMHAGQKSDRTAQTLQLLCSSCWCLYCSGAQFLFPPGTDCAMTTSTSDSDFQLLTLYMDSICSRTPSALRHSKRSNILAKDVNRNIQNWSKSKSKSKKRKTKKCCQQKFLWHSNNLNRNNNNNNSKSGYFPLHLKSTFLLAFALRICPAAGCLVLPVRLSDRLALQFQIFCHLRQVPQNEGTKRGAQLETMSRCLK